MSLSTFCLANECASAMSTPSSYRRLRDLVGNAGEDHAVLEQQQTLQVQRPLPVQEVVPPARHHDLRYDDGCHGVLACGHAAYFLLYGDPELPEGSLDHVELHRDVVFLPGTGDRLHLAGVERHEQGPRLVAPQRPGVVDCLNG